MSSSTSSEHLLSSVIRMLNNMFPLELAESWDNVGLLVQPSSDQRINKILLTNDLTEEVLNEAIEQQVELIFSYHPPLFRALKTLTMNSWKERIILRCAEERIAIYSPHTAADAVKSGVNDWLISPLSTKSSLPVQPSHFSIQPEGQGMGRIATLQQPILLRNVIETYKKHLNLPHLRVAFGKSHNLGQLQLNTIKSTSKIFN
jgi:dinuclear metal center YbgI/SA1388 family protein